MNKLPSLQNLLEAGVHFGHQVRRGNPRMAPFIYGARDGVHIIDLTLSEKYLKEACEFLYEFGKSGKTLLLVGTKKQAQPIIEELAQKIGSPYLTERWMGGFLTNFDELSKNIKKLKELKEAKEKGELKKYTKKEQLLIDRKVAKLEKELGGVIDLAKVPDGIFVVDAVKEVTAVREANRKGITVVAIADSNCDVSLIDYPVPGNDDAIKSIKILSEALIGSFEEGKKEAKSTADKKEADDIKQAEKDAQIAVLEEDVAAAEEIVEKKEVEASERKV